MCVKPCVSSCCLVNGSESSLPAASANVEAANERDAREAGFSYSLYFFKLLKIFYSIAGFGKCVNI